ncbi:MAG: MBL fold metallo-hydrolase [Chloroflexi bacterium]|nr:MBL fold metallo-hydrolase [Chloroflexota bacterium]
MQLRILGAHNMESRDTRLESHLIDGALVLDAGSLTRALNFEEQLGIKAILLSHRHFDHVRDLLPLGLALRLRKQPVELYAIEDTAEALRSHIFSGHLYPDFLEKPGQENFSTFRLNVVDFFTEFRVLGYKAVAVPVPHAVPAAGFLLSYGGANLFYTGDTGKGLSNAWKHVAPDVLLTEVTFGSEYEQAALDSGHLTPKFLAETLKDFRKLHGRLPRVIVAHMNPPWESAIRSELATLSRDLHVEITISRADMELTL